MSRRYQVVNHDRIYDWLAGEDSPERREALLSWVAAASIDPEAVTTGYAMRAGSGHRFNVSYVRDAGCVVTFLISAAPVRALIVLDVSAPTSVG